MSKTDLLIKSFLSLALALLVAAGFGCQNATTTSAPAKVAAAPAREFEEIPNDPFFAKFHPKYAPRPAGLLLKKGDRLAIIGDSITEQKQYSRIMETYLTVCVPELQITARQYGWSGERADGFLRRMTNDCLRFEPTIATTCYGMNDHQYKPYEEAIGAAYRKYSTAIVQSFKAHGVRVVQGSPGPVGKMPGWVRSAAGTVEDLNLSLCQHRNIGVEIAQAEQVGFADVFWPMFTGGFTGRKNYGPDYAIAGKDGVHPGWAGQTVMAYAFLKSLGVDGDIGTITVDLKSGAAKTSTGHEVLSGKTGEWQIKSSRYPYCAIGSLSNDNSIRSAMTLIPFNQDLNRLMLVAKGGKASGYKVTWGEETKTYSSAQLAKGVNLAADFSVNPFTEAFKKVDAAVGAKQNYETTQIKNIFHGAEGKADMEAAVKKTEAERAPLAEAIKTAFVPVTHTIRLEAN